MYNSSIVQLVELLNVLNLSVSIQTPPPTRMHIYKNHKTNTFIKHKDLSQEIVYRHRILTWKKAELFLIQVQCSSFTFFTVSFL